MDILTCLIGIVLTINATIQIDDRNLLFLGQYIGGFLFVCLGILIAEIRRRKK